MLAAPYQYLATVTRVIDGDTVEVVREAGCDITQRLTLRLYGINTPEMRGETKAAGLLARAYLVSPLAEHHPKVLIRTHRDKADSFRRYLAEVIAERPDGTVTNLNQALVAAGHAVEFMTGE